MKLVETDKKIGVWLDHRQAHFIDVSKRLAIVETAFSGQESQPRYEGEHGMGTLLGHHRSTNNEHHMHNRRENIIAQYYEMIIDMLKQYDSILLFGPTNAKYELHNRLLRDKHFDTKVVIVKVADHLTEQQMVAEVKAHFCMDNNADHRQNNDLH